MWFSLLLLTSVLCTHVQEAQSQTVADLQEKIDQMKTSLDIVAMSVQMLSAEVAYEARSEDDVAYTDLVKIKFTDVVYNAGGGYNKDTGIFTVPISGTYLLWAHIMRADTGRMAVFINGNHGNLLKGYITQGTNSHGVASVTGLAHLQQGDEVYLYKGNLQRTTVRGDAFSSYGGVLLKAQ